MDSNLKKYDDNINTLLENYLNILKKNDLKLKKLVREFYVETASAKALRMLTKLLLSALPEENTING